MTQRRTTPRCLAVALVAAALMLAACGGGDEETSAPASEDTPAKAPEQPPAVDTDAVERELKKTLHGISLSALPVPVYPPGGGPPQQTELGGGKVKVRSVTCPKDVPAEKGGTFTCDVNAAKTEASVRLTQLNRSGTKLRFKATLKSEMTTGVTQTTRLRGTIDTEK